MNLAIVQNRYIRTWIMSTINLLENSAGLYQFTLELPWPGFAPENITYLIRQFSDYHALVNKVSPAYPLPVATSVAAASNKPGAPNTEVGYDRAPGSKTKTSLKTVLVKIINNHMYFHT